MGIQIQKPISKEYLAKQLSLLAGHELYEMVEEEIIDVPENYVRDDGTDPNALLVVDDSSATPSTGEVGISVVSDFISDITAGEYVVHIAKQSHIGDVREEKYARRLGEDMPEGDIEDLWDSTQENVEVYKSLIQDTMVSKNFLWSSDRTNTEIQDTVTKAKAYVDKLFGESATIKIEVVKTLPTKGQSGTIYIYDNGTGFPIYIYSEENGGWINTGSDLSAIDLSSYVKKDQVVTDTVAGLMTPTYKKALDNLTTNGVMFADGIIVEPLES